MEKFNEKKIADFKRGVADIVPALKYLGEAFDIPFDKSLKILEQDRELAMLNYKKFEQMIDSGDDSNSAKEGLNNAVLAVIKSTDKLNKMMETTSKMIGDAMKSMALIKANESRELDKNKQTNIREIALRTTDKNES